MKLHAFILLTIIFGILGSSLGWRDAAKRNKTDVNRPNSRVFGGYYIPKVRPEKPYFVVYVKYYEDATSSGPPDYICTASIVAASTLLSTAYCLDNAGLTTDRFSTEITGYDGVIYTRAITSVLLHPNYDADTVENNIALGYVDTPYDIYGALSPLAAISLPSANDWSTADYADKFLSVCGMLDPYITSGFYVNSQPTCNIFMLGDVDWCNNDYGLGLFGNEACAYSSDMTEISVCYMDFGAALYYYNSADLSFTLMGVASYTFDNRCAEGPTAYVLIQGTEYDFVNDNKQD